MAVDHRIQYVNLLDNQSKTFSVKKGQKIIPESNNIIIIPAPYAHLNDLERVLVSSLREQSPRLPGSLYKRIDSLLLDKTLENPIKLAILSVVGSCLFAALNIRQQRELVDLICDHPDVALYLVEVRTDKRTSVPEVIFRDNVSGIEKSFLREEFIEDILKNDCFESNLRDYDSQVQQAIADLAEVLIDKGGEQYMLERLIDLVNLDVFHQLETERQMNLIGLLRADLKYIMHSEGIANTILLARVLKNLKAGPLPGVLKVFFGLSGDDVLEEDRRLTCCKIHQAVEA